MVEWVDLVSVRVVQYFLVCLLLICRACRRDIIDCTANLSSRPDIINKEMQLLPTVHEGFRLWLEYGIAHVWLEGRGDRLPW